jgi:hypothetical protein
MLLTHPLEERRALLVPEENHAVLASYRRRHPLAFRVFVKAFGFGYPLKGVGG